MNNYYPALLVKQMNMTDFLLGAGLFVLATVALGLVRILRGPAATDRMMAAQLFGTGGIATLLLLGVGASIEAAIDVALVLALLAAFSSVGFVKGIIQVPTANTSEK